jgi:hypothetical protein
MEALLLPAALFLGYGYAKSAAAMKDQEDNKITENNVLKHRDSVRRRVEGYHPMTYEQTEKAADDFASHEQHDDRQPHFTRYIAPDPAWQRTVFTTADQPERMNPNYYRDLQKAADEHWDCYNDVMALKDPNASYRGNFSEIGNMRAYRPARNVAQPFA